VYEDFFIEVHAVEYADGCSRIVPKQFRKSIALALLYSIHLHVRECLGTILNCRGTINPLAQLSWPHKPSCPILLHPFCTTLLHAVEYADGCSRIVPRQFRQSIALALFYCIHHHHYSAELFFRCRSLSAKEPLIIGFFCGKWPMNILHVVDHHFPQKNPIIVQEDFLNCLGTILLHPSLFYCIRSQLSWHYDTKLLHNLMRHKTNAQPNALCRGTILVHPSLFYCIHSQCVCCRVCCSVLQFVLQCVMQCVSVCVWVQCALYHYSTASIPNCLGTILNCLRTINPLAQLTKSIVSAVLYCIHLHVRKCLGTILKCLGPVNPRALFYCIHLALLYCMQESMQMDAVE